MNCQKCKKHGECVLEPSIGASSNVVCHNFVDAVGGTSTRDDVNHPSHYAGKYECIEVMHEIFGAEAVKGFCVLNAFKYLWRSNKKHKSPAKDIEKARWYLNKHHEIVESEADQE